MTNDQAQVFMKMLDQHIEDLRHFSLLPQDATGDQFKQMQIDLEVFHAALARDYGPVEARRP